MSPDRSAVSPAPQRGAWAIVHAARRVGISASTLRSWEHRYGIAPSARTPGGHRRYTADDIADLQTMARLVAAGMPTATAAATLRRRKTTKARRSPRRGGPTPADALADEFRTAAEQLDSAALAQHAEALLAKHGALHCWLTVFAPYLQQVGRRWELEGSGIECEHVAAATLQVVFDRHTWRHSPASDRPAVLLCATDTEHHTLPLHAAAAVLAERTIGTRVLGRLPGSAIQDAARVLGPNAVLLWSLREETADRELLAGLTTAVPIVFAAGPGWSTRALPETVIRVDHLDDIAGLVAASG